KGQQSLCLISRSRSNSRLHLRSAARSSPSIRAKLWIFSRTSASLSLSMAWTWEHAWDFCRKASKSFTSFNENPNSWAWRTNLWSAFRGAHDAPLPSRRGPASLDQPKLLEKPHGSAAEASRRRGPADVNRLGHGSKDKPWS